MVYSHDAKQAIMYLIMFFVLLSAPGPWLQKILYDMTNKTNPGGNQTIEDMKLFLYSAVSKVRVVSRQLQNW